MDFKLEQIHKDLAYLVECELATFSDYACKKSASKCETHRYYEICVIGINMVMAHIPKEFFIEDGNRGWYPRVCDIIVKYKGNVLEWVRHYDDATEFVKSDAILK
jgi:hypothetical protein